MKTRFSQNYIMYACEAESFWQEIVIAVVIQLQALARIS